MKAAALLVVSLSWFAACGGDDGAAAYPTYQECFDERVEGEGLVVTKAIVLCCLENPIAGTAPACGDAAPDCINYLTANLNQTDATPAEVMESCADYVDQKSMPTEK
ncbi:MAG: hypothetical protein JWP01_650 [Myxococcales bacterium]|nr:hypothetical protein [Myxococcales bacterium]